MEAAGAEDPREGVHFMVHTFNVPCGRCGRNFTQPASLRVHHNCMEKRLLHLNHPYNKYECYKCGKKFRTMSQLRQHVTFHLQRMFHCLICGIDHYTKQQVIRHVQCEHNRLKMFSCPESGCQKRYTENRQLKKHMVRMGHGGHVPVRNSISYASDEDDGSLDESYSSLSPKAPQYPPHDSQPGPMEKPAAGFAPTHASAANSRSQVIETDQLNDFLNFQRFLSMMHHCKHCDGYFMSEDLLQAHHHVSHDTKHVTKDLPDPTLLPDEEENSGILALTLPGHGDDILC